MHSVLCYTRGMIAWLNGILERTEADTAVVNVNGVGFSVSLPPYPVFPFEIGSVQRIPVHIRVTNTPGEINLVLFGFASEVDKQIFLWLLTQKGIGPKQALSLTGLGADQLLMALVNNDWVKIAALPGLGKKTAQRLCVTLADPARDRLGSGGFDPSGLSSHTSTSFAAGGAVSDALEALVALGYSESDARKRILSAHDTNPSADSTELIRLALKSR